MQKVCVRCGWQNELSAVMCGGCGQPLSITFLPPSDPNAITEPELRSASSLAGSRSQSRGTIGTALPAPMPRAYPAAVARPRTGGRVLRAVLLVVLALGALVTLAWITLIRPSLHQRVDASLRAQLIALTQQVPTSLEPGTYRLDAQVVTNALQLATPANSPISNPAVHFSSGRIVLTYQLLGHTDALVTSLVPAHGRLVAQDTTARGWLGLVESGPELQAVINDALAFVPASVDIKQFTARNDELAVTVG
jgi:hypothetical protein